MLVVVPSGQELQLALPMISLYWPCGHCDRPLAVALAAKDAYQPAAIWQSAASSAPSSA